MDSSQNGKQIIKGVIIGELLPGELLDDMPDLTIDIEGDTLVAHGDIDLHQVQHFRKIAEKHLAAVDAPRFDLSDVPFLDSAGLATLVYLIREARAQGKAIRVLADGGPRRVLRITGIDQMLTMEEMPPPTENTEDKG